MKEPVYVEEKIDGSQFSFGLDTQGEYVNQIRVRSKGVEMNPDAPEKLFSLAVQTVKDIAHRLTPGWTYRAEYLRTPKHNTLAYNRIPNLHLIIFDINTGHEHYLSYEEKKAEAERIGLEVVPKIFEGMIEDAMKVREFLTQESILGGQRLEGVVIKPVGYGLWGKDKKCLMGKFVSEAFKEIHGNVWKEANPGQGDILTLLGQKYSSPARWNKAIQHLQEAGKLEDSVRDIGLLMKEIPGDIEKECEEEIKQQLYDWGWPHIRRMVCRGFPEFYKEMLLKKQFEK